MTVPSTIVIRRDGSFALAFSGSVRSVGDPVFSVALGRNSLALNLIVDLVSCSLGTFILSDVQPTPTWPSENPQLLADKDLTLWRISGTRVGDNAEISPTFVRVQFGAADLTDQSSVS